jgi:hypothetical protein
MALYAKVPAYGNTFVSGMALLDQAKLLLESRKQEAGCQLLRSLIPNSSGRIQLIARVWLASALYQQGDVVGAQSIANQALPLNPASYQQGENKELYITARDIFNRTGGWKTQSIESDVKELTFKANPLQPDKPLYARFRIKTYGGTSVTATVDNPLIQVSILPIDNWHYNDNGVYEEKSEVVVKVANEDISRMSDSKIRIFSVDEKAAVSTIVEIKFLKGDMK